MNGCPYTWSDIVAERVGEAHGQPELLLLEVREQVVRHVARVRRGTARLHLVRRPRVAGADRRRDARRHLEVEPRTQIDALGPPAVAPPVVDPEGRDDRFAVVPVQTGPRREVRILTDGGTAAPARVAVRLAQLAQGAPGMERPGVVERDVRVGVERALLGQAPAGPVLPPVGIPLKPLVQGAPVAIEVSDPGAPGLLVRALQVAQVVDFEAGGAPLVAGLPQEVRAAHLADLQLYGITGERQIGKVGGTHLLGQTSYQRRSAG